jgi:pimeloyl-ACP methyl ester carboxylesterase
VACVLELHDPLASDSVEFASRRVPLETDLTTPLGYYLDNPDLRTSNIATWGLLNPNRTGHLRGLSMLEAFDPNKIPVLMVHGLWSSPETWTEMINDLRSLPEIRNRYQFWTYLYPTGQPFWISAAQMRQDLEHVRQSVNPDHRWPALDQMVVIGHSMGGLVARMQTLDSGDDFWGILSDQPFDELATDAETRGRLAGLVFFRPNPSIRRVITLGTPHRGSTFANDYTRWLARKLITLPTTLVQTKSQIARDNPGFFRNTEMLTVSTSIDSLSPDSPVLPVMLRSQRAPWVRYHNIVGVVSKRNLLARLSETGDGVVAFSSARLDDAESEIVVDADHVHVHQHPRSILEVRRILIEHAAEMEREVARWAVLSAASRQPRVSPESLRAVLPPVPESGDLTAMPGGEPLRAAAPPLLLELMP